MKQMTLTIAFLAFIIGFSSASFVQKPFETFNVLTEIQALESDDFGKKILDTITLQIRNKAPLQDVSALLAKIRANLINQQGAADALQASREAECKKDIAEYNRRIVFANKEIEESTQNIATLSAIVEQLEGQIANKQAQLKILGQRDVTLKSNFESDKKQFAKRVVQHEDVIAALDIIIPKLRAIPSGQVKTAKSLLVELAKIGHNNPISALVQLAMSLDPKALQNVVDKLAQIRGSLAASLADDKAAQAKAQASFEAMVAEISQVTANTQKSLEEDQDALAQNQAKLASQRKRLSDNQDELKQASAGLKAKTALCAQWKAQYDADTKQRSSEVAVVTKVQHILATKLETMNGYLKKRVNKL